MKVSHISFVPIKWMPDKILTTLINPEVGYFTIHIKDYISTQISVNKNIPLNMAGMSIKWMYTIENHTQTKEFLFCEANDNHMINNISDNEDEFNSDIKKSFKRFTNYFDQKKIELELKELHLLLSENEVEKIRQEILSRLRN